MGILGPRTQAKMLLGPGETGMGRWSASSGPRRVWRGTRMVALLFGLLSAYELLGMEWRGLLAWSQAFVSLDQSEAKRP